MPPPFPGRPLPLRRLLSESFPLLRPKTLALPSLWQEGEEGQTGFGNQVSAFLSENEKRLPPHHPAPQRPLRWEGQEVEGVPSG